MTYINATYKFVEPEDGQWGAIDENGNWTGLIGNYCPFRLLNTYLVVL